jgi:hypothetical protein
MYHITEPENVQSIMRLGLLPGTMAKGLRSLAGRYVYLAASIEDALQLAPAMGEYYVLRRFQENTCKRCSKYYLIEQEEYVVSVLTVDVSGLSLIEGDNRAQEPWVYGKGWVPLKEYMYPSIIPPDRIIEAHNISLFYPVPGELKPEYKSAIHEYEQMRGRG